MFLRFGTVFLLIILFNVKGIRGEKFYKKIVPINTEFGNTTRDSRFLPILTVVRVPNSICTVNGEQGACKTRKQCLRDGGIPFGGNCANGFGVCCMITRSCSASNNGQPIIVTSSGTHLTHPTGYIPPFQCQFTIPRKPGVCQLRLDFVQFNLNPPNPSGDCDVDLMTITGADNLPSTFMVCGTATGQHLYLHYVTAESITISIILNGNASSTYDLLVTFIECRIDNQLPFKTYGKVRKLSTRSNFIKPAPTIGIGDTNTIEPAPPGCSQYYTKASDTVQSFNYRNVNISSNSVQYQINNEQYSVCVKSAYGSKKITWQPCTATDAFFVSGSSIPPMLPVEPCMTDYVDIPGSMSGRYCGSTFPASVMSQIKPFMMYVNFNEKELLGLDLPTDPLTGCCARFCECHMNGVKVPDAMPGAAAPCGPTIPNTQCVVDQFLVERSDFYNTGFCLRYTLS